MATNWTAEQRRAIETPGSLIVSAAAGSGKTAVLTERIARHILEGASPDDLLVVTFTRAAAAEMKKRIGDRLSALAAQQQGDEAARLYGAAESIGRANISTIDGFCSHVLRRHFDIAGLDPAFRAGEEAENLALRQEALDELMERYYAQKGFSDLVDAFGEEAEFSAQFLRLYEFIMAQPEPMEWLKEAIDKYDIAEDALPLCPAAEEYLKGLKVRLGAYMDILRSRRDEIAEDYPKTAAILDDDLTQLGGALLQKSLRGYANQLSACAFATFSMRGAEKSYSEYVKKLRDDMKKEVKKHIALSGKPIGRQAKLLAGIKPLLDMLYSFTGDFIALYSEKKEQAGIIDYADMEHIALGLLRLPAVAKEYRDRFSFVFIDEYQDCSPLQNALFSALARPDNLFIVGDVKQSIYRFRLAEPALFMQRYADYQRGNGGELICLNHNFRSACGVINAVNSLFSRIMHREAGEIEYDDEAALRFGRNDGGEDETRAEFILLDMMDAQADAEETETDTAAVEAAAAARRIHELMDTERITDTATGEERPLKYSDFAVLLRSYKGSAETWMRTLAANGVLAYALLSDGYFDAIEVRVFMDLLRIIDNRRQDIPLAAVLRSPIGGFDERELIALKTDFPAPPEREEDWAWIDRVNAAAAAGGELGQKAKRFMDKLEYYRQEAKLLGAEALIGMLLDETGYGEYCAAMPGGRQRQANLEALCERARGCAAAGVRSLGGFLSYMEKVSAANVYGAPQTGGANVVSIMSIHASKGLEFPYVIIGGLNSGFVREGMDNLVCEKELGIGARLISGEIKRKSFLHEAITAALSAKATAEEMRVLYVAMTRARERLIMLCAAKDGAKLVNGALAPQTQSSIIMQKSFAAWLLGHILNSKSGNEIRAKYGLKPVFEPDAHIYAHCEPAPLAMPGGGRMDESKYNEFVRDALAYADKKPGGFFTRTYAHAADVELPTKLSVTSLSGGEHTDLTDAPSFAREENVAPAQFGTAVHEIMRRLPLDKPITERSVAEFAQGLVKAGLMDETVADTVPARSIAAFFNGELGQRLLRAETVRREVEFNLRIGAKELLGADTGETVLLQGVIDCCFAENGEWVLIDYKTDRVAQNYSAYDVAKKHFAQLRLYKTALERLTGRKVRQSYIYLFSIGKAVELSEDF
mgnify:CR=1 FL=1